MDLLGTSPTSFLGEVFFFFRPDSQTYLPTSSPVPTPPWGHSNSACFCSFNNYKTKTFFEGMTRGARLDSAVALT
jgi:hypothetical protein